jgi:DNA-binding NarL/FixJ family response regulator
MNSESTKKILVIDDHALVREGLVCILEKQQGLHVCGQVEDFDQAIKKIEEKNPDLVVLDISIGNCRGMELIRAVKARWEELPVLVLTLKEETVYAERAIRAGARGYIMKQESLPKIISAVRHVLEGGLYVSRNLNDCILMSLTGACHPACYRPIRELSDREFEVFRLIGRAWRPRQIAEIMNLNVPTVESYRTKIRSKLKIKSASELSQYAIQWFFDKEKI